MSMFYSEEKISQLREKVKQTLTLKRFNHTLGVERTAALLGSVFLKDRVSELRVAALLHDITKELSRDEHLKFIKDSEYTLDPEELGVYPAYHSFSAPVYVKKYYPDYATKDILDAIFNHTLGAPGFSLFSEIIFISDYIEDGRTHSSCINVRDFLFNELEKSSNIEQKIRALHMATIQSIDLTEKHLLSQGFEVCKKTLLTKKELSALI